MQEHFEVISVTFQDEKVNSKATSDYGWRVTPYAYLLLKARGPKIDKIPPLRLDLDFMDTSGYVVLPVESPTIPVDAAPASGPVHPFEKLQITQTLDERQAQDGKLILEIKGVARGLVPDLDEILALDHAGFQVEKVDDQGLSVSKFDPDSEATMIDSDRTWLVSYRAAADQPKPPATFRFASAKVDGAEMTYQRYVDADLAKVGPEVCAGGAVRAAEVCLALVGWRRIAGSGVPGGRDLDDPVPAQEGRRPALPDARAGHAFLGARPPARDPPEQRAPRDSVAGAGRLDRSGRAPLLRRDRRRTR